MATATSTTSNSDPWILAKERYLEGLEPYEKTLFHEATLENFYYGTSNLERDNRNSKTRKIIQKLQPLVEKVEDFGKALDVYANIAPTYISPIWGSIRVLIVVAKAYGKFYDQIVETLGRIGDILPRFRKYGPFQSLLYKDRLLLAQATMKEFLTEKSTSGSLRQSRTLILILSSSVLTSVNYCKARKPHP
jgi:fungal STAND N-terminal Goodbye domain